MWANVDPTQDYRPNPLPNFVNNPGLCQQRNIQSVCDYVDLFITPQMWTHIVQCSNQAGARYHAAQNQAPPRKHQVEWSVISIEEMKKFFATLLFMGMMKHQHMSLYWSRRGPYSNDFFRRTQMLHRDRFFQIL